MKSKLIEAIEAAQVRKLPDFRPGDTLRVHFRILEGEVERQQVFEGVCICRRRGGNRGTITVRKISFTQGVERIFPLASPRIEKIDVVQRGQVRRAKLFYLRALRGKKARIKAKSAYAVPTAVKA
jgi:large subunit ribosomal protein L19